MKEVYGIIYETTNLINGMKYLGRHRIYNGIIEDGYLGSGTYLKNAINKYGAENFIRLTLCECYTEDELNEKEDFYLNLYDCANNPAYYNQTNCSYLGGTSGLHHRDDVKERMSKSAKSRGISDETRKKMLISRQGSHPIQSEEKKASLRRYWSSEEGESRKLKQSELMKGNTFAEGFKQSEETKKKRSESLTGKVWVHKGYDKTRINPEDLQDYLSKGWIQGLPESFSELRRDHMISNIIIHKGEIIKTIPKEELDSYLSDGWKVGNMTESAREKLRKSSEGKIWVQNGIKAVKISQDELQVYLDQGYVRGQKIRPIIKHIIKER